MVVPTKEKIAILKDKSLSRVRAHIRGAVQGVGFRPFVYRLASDLKLTGWVNNSSQGLIIEAEGVRPRLETFLIRIQKEKPPRSSIHSFKFTFLDYTGYKKFEIRPSDKSRKKTTVVLADIATCPDCLKEISDPRNRRYLYPFTNCTNCGPRYSIIESLPYDRVNTTMKKFKMCKQCQSEYEDPSNRRFHAQPNACMTCGPHLELLNTAGNILNSRGEALTETVNAIKSGKIVAIKGLGGFHLVCDAENEKSVLRLRERKNREEKPFALMFPSLKSIREECLVSDIERHLLQSPEAPIVLLSKKDSKKTKSQIAPSVAPGNPYLGIMLPYTPLHHILMNELKIPIVATSANISDEPICTDEKEALEVLSDIADLFLIHNRPIVHHADDSIVRIVSGRPMVMRRARGYAPLPVHIKEEFPTILAVGGHLKNTVAINAGDNVFLSQHIGDLETKPSFDIFKKTSYSLQKLYALKPSFVACDNHPQYISTQYAQSLKIPVIKVQHHHAHIAACMAENEVKDEVFGVSWDGTGYGTDESIWGGEFLISTLKESRRLGHFRTFRLPGAEAAIKEPRRIALGLLYEIFGREILQFKDIATFKSFSRNELDVILGMIKRGFNSPLTSSVGRIFDAVASLTGICQRSNFEGQAAMSLEYALYNSKVDSAYSFRISDDFIVDWSDMIKEIINDVRSIVNTSDISRKFHNTLIEIIVNCAKQSNEKKIALSGGCFQNRYLTEGAIRRLKGEGFRVYWHQRVPPNDGGISLGQIVTAASRIKKNDF